MLTLVRVDAPEREPRAVERRLHLERSGQVVHRRRGCLGEQPLDVVFERRDRRVRAQDLLRRPRRRRSHAPGEALEHRKEVDEWPGLGRIDPDPPGLEHDASRVRQDRLALQPERPHDDLRRANQLPDADEGGVRERVGGGHLEALEGGAAIFSADGVDAERRQIVRQEHRGRLTEPHDAALLRDVLERHHERLCRAGAGCAPASTTTRQTMRLSAARNIRRLGPPARSGRSTGCRSRLPRRGTRPPGSPRRCRTQPAAP